MTTDLSHLDFKLDTSEASGGAWDKLDAIREADPVFYSDIQKGYLITRHEDVREALSDRRLSAERVSHLFADLPEDAKLKYKPMVDSMPLWIVMGDAPIHTRLRKLLLKGFTTKVIEGLRGLTEDSVDELLDHAEEKGEIDFIEDFAFVLPAYLIMKLLGVPRELLDDFKRWSLAYATLIGTRTPSVKVMDEALDAFHQMNGVFGKLIAERRAEPQDDLLTALVNARDEGDQLSEEELLATCQLIMVAGHETTTNMLGNGLQLLINDPEQRQWMVDNDYPMRPVVEELLRVDGVINSMVRFVREDFEWHGKQIKKGDIVYLMIHAANRDPQVYENAADLDFTRENKFPLSFGPGIHFCLGHQLARMELEVTFERIFKRFEKVEILDSTPDWNASMALHGMRAFNVKFTPKKQPELLDAAE